MNLKPFDLEAALRGEYVKLCDGSKAVVLLDYRDVNRKYGGKRHSVYPIRGTVINGSGEDLTWTATGAYQAESVTHHLDIVGMWEEPPATITIGDMEVPAPYTEEPLNGEGFWTVILTYSTESPDRVQVNTWSGCEFDFRLLNAGLAFKTREDAEKAHTALLALMKQQMEKVKEQKK